MTAVISGSSSQHAFFNPEPVDCFEMIDVLPATFEDKYTLNSSIYYGPIAMIGLYTEIATSRKVVIKINTDEEHLENMENEAETLELLQGAPGVVKLIEYAEINEAQLAIITEYAGESLEILLSKERLPRVLLIKLCFQIVAFIEYLNKKNFEHGDLTIGNICYKDEMITVIDWEQGSEMEEPTHNDIKEAGEIIFYLFTKESFERDNLDTFIEKAEKNNNLAYGEAECLFDLICAMTDSTEPCSAFNAWDQLIRMYGDPMNLSE